MSDSPVNIVKLNTPNLMDIAASLRKLSDRIASGEIDAYEVIAVVVDKDGMLSTYGHGAIGTVAHDVGVLYMAALHMATLR